MAIANSSSLAGTLVYFAYVIWIHLKPYYSHHRPSSLPASILFSFVFLTQFGSSGLIYLSLVYHAIFRTKLLLGSHGHVRYQ